MSKHTTAGKPSQKTYGTLVHQLTSAGFRVSVHQSRMHYHLTCGARVSLLRNSSSRDVAPVPLTREVKRVVARALGVRDHG